MAGALISLSLSLDGKLGGEAGTGRSSFEIVA